jgi:hypothetical protein
MIILTDEEIIKRAKEFMATHKYTNKAQLRRVCNTSTDRLKRLEKEGHFVLPLNIPRGAACLVKKDDVWRKFKLRGSPLGGKQKPTRVPLTIEAQK